MPVPDVGSHVEIARRRDRFEQQFCQPSAETRPQPPHAERDQTDKRTPLEQVQLERHFLLQNPGVHGVMNEHRGHPVAQEQRFKGRRVQALPLPFAGTVAPRCCCFADVHFVFNPEVSRGGAAFEGPQGFFKF